MSAPPARCLDITRLTSRLGGGPLTGVDRVELAYLRHLASDPVPLYPLARTALGYLLVGPDGARKALERFEGRASWGRPDLIGRAQRRAHPLKRRAEADLRRWAVARCRKRALPAMLRAHLPAGTAYLNVGHSNLTDSGLLAWRNVPQARVAIMIHDTIPLDFPQYQRAQSVTRFRQKLAAVSARADLVICNSVATRADAERWMHRAGRVPEMVVAHLGVDLVLPDPARLPADLDLTRPWFVTVGTIEPRKNHALLLDVWQALGPDAPVLFIAGRRGWANEQVFRRLDSDPAIGRTIFERADLDDAALAALVAGSRGLLFPTLAEGYGLPALEAAARGIPVICADLPVFRELLGDIPVYAESPDVYSWTQTIRRMTAEERADHNDTNAALSVPTWADHFNRVLRVI